MFTLKRQKQSVIAFLCCSLLILLLAEPTLAKNSDNNGRSAGRGATVRESVRPSHAGQGRQTQMMDRSARITAPAQRPMVSGNINPIREQARMIEKPARITASAERFTARGNISTALQMEQSRPAFRNQNGGGRGSFETVSVSPKREQRDAKSTARPGKRTFTVEKRNEQPRPRQSWSVKTSPFKREKPAAFDSPRNESPASGTDSPRTSTDSHRDSGTDGSWTDTRRSFDSGRTTEDFHRDGRSVDNSTTFTRRRFDGDRHRDNLRFHQRSKHFFARNHHGHSFRFFNHKRFRQIWWPSYHRTVYYNCGPYYNFQYIYPYYHRKHIFVSFGGWWPYYTYRRYYWYPCHSYFWYGYYPPVYRVDGDTYNYYTYNYYGTDDSTAQGTYGLTPVDANTFADVRERLAAEKEGPADETVADRYFEEGVQAFEKGDYASAASKFAAAIDLESNDVVLPFAYCQALFASGRYSEAAEVLRGAVEKLPPDQEGVIFPRGLYPNDDILFEQIGILADKAELDSDNEDLQLLLGYQLLGAEKFDQAVEPLQRIDPYGENGKTAAALIALLEKIRTDTDEQTSGQ